MCINSYKHLTINYVICCLLLQNRVFPQYIETENLELWSEDDICCIRVGVDRGG